MACVKMKADPKSLSPGNVVLGVLICRGQGYSATSSPLSDTTAAIDRGALIMERAGRDSVKRTTHQSLLSREP
jgi:hypothetical protein